MLRTVVVQEISSTACQRPAGRYLGAFHLPRKFLSDKILTSEGLDHQRKAQQ